MIQTAGSQKERVAQTSNIDVINVAGTCSATRALGPGLRAVVWVQGCPFRCPGCIAPDWIPLRPANLIQPEILAELLLKNPLVTGLTISGGEPMLQAQGLAYVVHYARKRRDLNVICFSGFRLEQLRDNPPGPGVLEFLQTIDVLIDGSYIERLNDNLGLRGSRNQRIIHLTDRLRGENLDSEPRKAEVHLQEGQMMLVGVPPLRMKEAFHDAADRVNQLRLELLHNERL